MCKAAVEQREAGRLLLLVGREQGVRWAAVDPLTQSALYVCWFCLHRFNHPLTETV
jgi:hypothetical protein